MFDNQGKSFIFRNVLYRGIYDRWFDRSREIFGPFVNFGEKFWSFVKEVWEVFKSVRNMRLGFL